MTARVAFYRGEDGVGIRRAIDDLAGALGEPPAPLERWVVDASQGGQGRERAALVLDEVAERLATAPLFGGGTLVVVRQPANLLRDAANRARLLGLVPTVPPGDGLVFSESVVLKTSRQGPLDPGGPLARAVDEAGGEVRLFPAPRGARMVSWLAERAAELDIRLEPEAAALLVRLVGADLSEGDMDRRSQTELAWSGLQSLALLRPGGAINRSDVAALVPEVIPSSTWALLDAVGRRQASDAARLVERLLRDGWPIQVLTSLLHRRLRELIMARDLIDRRRPPADLVKLLGTSPGRASIIARQAQAWRLQGLREALEGLLDLDLASKGLAADGSTRPTSDGRSALTLQAWLAEHVPPGPGD